MTRSIAWALVMLLAGTMPARAAVTPRDEYFRHQWGMTAIGAPLAWTVTQGNAAIVAVIDTGVDADHPDLPRVLDGIDLVDGDGDAADENGHGTLIAGVIAATTDRVGVAGVAPGARILPVRVLGEDGTGDAADVATGIDRAMARGANVINLSLAEQATPPGEEGGLLRAPEVDLAIRRAASRGATVVVAAGNDHDHGGSEPTAYDASVPGVLVVGASTRSGARAAYSRYGRGLDLLAPGGGSPTDPSDEACDERTGIVSTWWDPSRRASGYGAACGTSMSVGFVAGVAALLHATGMRNTAITRRILATATDVAPAGRDAKTGAGIIDAARALGAIATVRRPRATASVAAVPVPTEVEPVRPLIVSRRPPTTSRTVEIALALILLALVGGAHGARAVSSRGTSSATGPPGRGRRS